MTGEPAHGWSASLLRTLAVVFETLVPGTETDAPRRARLAAETLDMAADHAELRLLKLAVRSLEVAPLNLATAGVWGRFSRLSRERRERVLLAWSTHPVARLRTAYQALRRLGLFLAYADDGGVAEGDEPANPLWSRVGYRLADPVDAPAPTIQPLDVERDAPAPLELEADAVVVGSGAGGGVVAARLAASGLSVLVVEAGPYVPEGRMPRLEGNAFRDLYLDRGTTATADLGITILAGSCLGGGTTVNWTTSFTPPDWLRDEWASDHGLVGFDRGETDDDLARLRAELDLHPPTVIPPKDRLILDGAAALGWEAAATERNAGPCTECGSCGFGCRRGAKRSGPRSHLAAAARDGARFLVEAPVDSVLLVAGRAVGVTGRLLDTGGHRSRPFVVRAPRVVAAAGALRTPLLLRRSGVDHGQLGRNLRLHPVAVVTARMADPVEMWLGPTQAARSLQFWRPGQADGGAPAHGGFVIESAPPHPGLIAAALPWSGGEADLARMGEVRNEAPLIAIMRDTGSGRVRWTRGGHPRIEYRLSAAEGRTARRALVEMARLAHAAGAQGLTAVATPPERWERERRDDFAGFERRILRIGLAPNRITLFSAHQMGSARAGSDPARHACDPWGRVRASSSGDGSPVPGLYVGDASLFPTASGVNPMVTVMALAERTARAVLQDPAG